MPRVLNKETGREHEVPAGHFSLTDALVYDVLPDLEPEPEAAAVVDESLEPEAPKPRTRKTK